jgi:hypothetical protein
MTRCAMNECTMDAVGTNEYCSMHRSGQRKRCHAEGCIKLAQWPSNHCKSHGGGYRCRFRGCDVSGIGPVFRCELHRGEEVESEEIKPGSSMTIKYRESMWCTEQDCTLSATAFTFLCKKHGGGRRCQLCAKFAKSKSLLCTTHNGSRNDGRRRCCSAPSCTKMSMANSDFCKHCKQHDSCMAIGCGRPVGPNSVLCPSHERDVADVTAAHLLSGVPPLDGGFPLAQQHKGVSKAPATAALLGAPNAGAAAAAANGRASQQHLFMSQMSQMTGLGDHVSLNSGGHPALMDPAMMHLRVRIESQQQLEQQQQHDMGDQQQRNAQTEQQQRMQQAAQQQQLTMMWQQGMMMQGMHGMGFGLLPGRLMDPMAAVAMGFGMQPGMVPGMVGMMQGHIMPGGMMPSGAAVPRMMTVPDGIGAPWDVTENLGTRCSLCRGKHTHRHDKRGCPDNPKNPNRPERLLEGRTRLPFSANDSPSDAGDSDSNNNPKNNNSNIQHGESESEEESARPRKVPRGNDAE